MSNARKFGIVSSACAACGMLVGCATPLAPTQSGFLSGVYSDLKPTNGDARSLSRMFVSAETLATYESVIIDPPTVRAAKLDQAGQDDLTKTLAKALADELGRARKVVVMPEGRTLRVRAMITAVDEVNVPLNVVTSIGFVSAVDNGGAAVEAQILDAETGAPLVEISFAHNAGALETIFGLESYSELGHACGALARFAATLASLTGIPAKPRAASGVDHGAYERGASSSSVSGVCCRMSLG